MEVTRKQLCEENVVVWSWLGGGWVIKKTKDFKLLDLSIGMSADYKKAILCGSTFLRLGTAIFGQREIKQLKS